MKISDLGRYGAGLDRSDPEEELAIQLRAAGVEFIQQFHFATDWTPPRKFRADFAIQEDGSGAVKLLVEVDGAVWTAGRHTRGDADYERDALCLIHGWKVLRVSPGQVKSGKALEWIEKVLTTAPSPLTRPFSSVVAITKPILRDEPGESRPTERQSPHSEV